MGTPHELEDHSVIGMRCRFAADVTPEGTPLGAVAARFEGRLPGWRYFIKTFSGRDATSLLTANMSNDLTRKFPIQG
jgi:hypothetical protein